MFVEIKNHPSILNAELVAFTEAFFLNLHHIQRIEFGKTTVYTYYGKCFQSRNLARIHAEGIAQQKAVNSPDLKFSPVFEQEIAQIKETEIDHIHMTLLDLPEKTELQLYFTEIQAFNQFKQALKQDMLT